MTTWLFDLGNSRLKLAPLVDGAPGPVVSVGHDGAALPSGWTDVLPARMDCAVIASVASTALRTDVLDALTRRVSRLVLARSQHAFGGVRIAYAQPERLGVDRFLALLGAHERGARPWLVVGVGTALTVDLLDTDGGHLGGRIAPSPTLMREALHARAPQLPATGGEPLTFACDTASALASGCEGAAIGLVLQSIAAATERIGAAPALLLHGGGAPPLQAAFPHARFAPALVLEGLAVWSRELALVNAGGGAS